MKITFQIENKIPNLREKLDGLILVIIIVILIIASAVYIVITNNSKNNNINNNALNKNIEENNITKEDIENTFTKYLSNEEWVKENLYIKKDYFGDEVAVYAKQDVSIATANDYVRIAIIEYEQSYTRNGKVLIYKDGNIQVQDLQNSRDGYLLDTEKNILYQYFQHMGEIRYTIYSINENGAEKVCSLSAHETGVTDNGEMILEDYKKDDVSITEEEFNNIKQQYINENLNEDEIFENINYLFEDEDILDMNLQEATLLTLVSDYVEGRYKLSKGVGEVIEDESTVTYINSEGNYYIFRLDLKYYPAGWDMNVEFRTDTSQKKEMQIFVLVNNETGKAEIYDNYTDAQNALYALYN